MPITLIELDLYLSLNNPFTSVKRNRTLYKRGVCLFALVLSVVTASKQGLFGFAEGKFCWTYAKRYAANRGDHGAADNGFFSFNVSTWVAFFSWMVLFYAFAFFVLGASFSRLRMGLSKTMETRKGMLRDGALSIISYTLYWTVAFSLYAASYNSDATPAALRTNPMFKLYCYVLAGRGIVTYFVWFVINAPQLVTTQWLHFAQDGRIDMNISAQLNASLQSDLLEYTVRGMLRAIHESDAVPRPRMSVESTESRSSLRLTSTFAQLRAHFDLKADDFATSFEEATKPSISEGASGAFMFFSKDMRFIVKSMVEGEARFLAKIAPLYRDHMLAYPHTKLTRFFGCFKITLHGNKFYFVVMENLFANAPEIHHRYDIKGSWTCPNLAGPHEPNVVLKDDDLHHRLRLGAEEGRTLLEQLQHDSVFLRDQGIMDYSLLIGVVDVQYKVDKSDAGVQNPHLCDSISGPGLYYVGVIDILQTWNWRKRMERWTKVWLRRKDPRGLSAMEPYPYQVRFTAKLRDLIATDEYAAASSSADTKHLQPLFAHNRSLEMVRSSSRPLPQIVKTRSTPHQHPRAAPPTDEPAVWL
ncbi:hypothetical protein DYB30_007515 [Aphanomyces astaci]|uniref:PIPK domain-containing protein n=3 Tax=Aphanomyces astaci TaxID=112090 RepID=A0A397D051_APHAT|nr:hypothetical protein DYB30_007515 [Aphanomyces astaci]